MNFVHAKGLRAKWKVLFGKPDDLDPRFRAVLERKLLNVHPQQRVTTPAIRQYVTAQTIFSLALLFIVILFEHYLTAVQLGLFSAFILVSLINSGAILDQRRWIFYLEYARVLIVLLAIGIFYPNSFTFILIIAFLSMLTWFFRPISRYYFKLLYS